MTHESLRFAAVPVKEIVVDCKLSGHTECENTREGRRTFRFPISYFSDDVLKLAIGITVWLQRAQRVVLRVAQPQMVNALASFIPTLHGKSVSVDAPPEVRRSAAFRAAVKSGLFPREGECLNVA